MPINKDKQKVIDLSSDLVIAIYPGYYSKKMPSIGFSCGWYNKNTNYCVEWGNLRTRADANEVLRLAYPNAEIINFETVPITRNHSSDIRPMRRVK